MSDYWFKPKSYGYGATPKNWKGWVATLVFALVLLVPSVPLMVWPAVDHSGPTVRQTIVWLALLGLLSWVILRFFQTKTDGEWRWRWGGK